MARRKAKKGSTKMASPAEHVIDLLESDHPDPESLDWLRDGLRRYVNGCGTLSEALGIVESCPKGLRSAVRTARIRRAIRAAAALLPSESTTHSKATTVSSTLRRLARCYPRMSPKTEFEERLADAVRAADGSPPLAVSGLWRIIEGGIQDDEI